MDISHSIRVSHVYDHNWLSVTLNSQVFQWENEFHEEFSFRLCKSSIHSLIFWLFAQMQKDLKKKLYYTQVNMVIVIQNPKFALTPEAPLQHLLTDIELLNINNHYDLCMVSTQGTHSHILLTRGGESEGYFWPKEIFWGLWKMWGFFGLWK